MTVELTATAPTGSDTDSTQVSIDSRPTQAQVDAPSAPACHSSEPGVSINDGALYTNTATVTLNLTLPCDVTSFLASNDGGFLAAMRFAASSTSWTLSSTGSERLPKVVYIRLSNGQTLTDDIVLDETPPVIQEATATLTSGAQTAAVRSNLRLKASDKTSGLALIQTSTHQTLKYKSRLRVRLSRHTKVRVRDRAGNWSRWKKVKFS
jgi:hypothetical protein